MLYSYFINDVIIICPYLSLSLYYVDMDVCFTPTLHTHTHTHMLYFCFKAPRRHLALVFEGLLN